MPEKLIVRVREAALKGKSSMYRYMLANYQSFGAAIQRADGTPSWEAIATELAEDGLTDSDGKRPTSRTASGTWYRVQKAVAARKSGVKKAGRPKPPAPGIVRPVVGMAPVSPEQPTERPRTKFVSRPAVFKSLLPKKDRTNAVE
jgi:hypothetical protein